MKNLFFSGQAGVPKKSTCDKIYGNVTIGLEVDPDHHVIVNADCTLATGIADDFFRNLVVGRSLKDYNSVVLDLKKNYHGEIRDSIFFALRNIYSQYKKHY